MVLLCGCHGVVAMVLLLWDCHVVAMVLLCDCHGGVAMGLPWCCYAGREAYEQENWWYVKEWMLECLNKMATDPTDEVDLAEVYDHLAFAEYQV